MPEFEDWWAKNYGLRTMKGSKYLAKNAWKAALEHVIVDVCCGINYTSEDVKSELKGELNGQASTSTV